MFSSAWDGNVYLQTTSTSNNISFTHIVNTSDSAQQFTGTLFNAGGTQLGSQAQSLHDGSIAPNGRLMLSSADLESRFGASAWSGPAVLEVQGEESFELMTKLTSPSGVFNFSCYESSGE